MFAEEGSGSILQPGVQIRPQITEEQVIKMVKRLYGLDAVTINALNAYDDKNYYLTVEKNANYPDLWPHGYVLKILNSLDSKKGSFVEAQNGMMLYLSSHDVTCPFPVTNVNGAYYSLEKLSKTGDSDSANEHVVRLLAFQPGTLLHEVPCTSSLFYQAGKYIARVDTVLRGYQHSAYDNHKTLWMLDSVPLVRNFVFAVQEEERKALVEDVLSCFDSQVLPKINELEKGLLHGDFNEQNILVNEVGEGSGWTITAVLDFGDSQFSCYLFELAITVCYMTLQCKESDPLDVGGHVLAGYVTERCLPEQEFQLLKVCVSARLCQSLVLGAYSYLQDPGNEYLLTTAKTGWGLLKLLWETSEEALYYRWRTIMASYSEENK